MIKIFKKYTFWLHFYLVSEEDSIITLIYSNNLICAVNCLIIVFTTPCRRRWGSTLKDQATIDISQKIYFVFFAFSLVTILLFYTTLLYYCGHRSLMPLLGQSSVRKRLIKIVQNNVKSCEKTHFQKFLENFSAICFYSPHFKDFSMSTIIRRRLHFRGTLDEELQPSIHL